MKEFALVFRRPPFDPSRTSPKDMQEIAKKWDAWHGELISQDKMGTVVRLDMDGKVLKAGGVITDGPFVEVREILGGIFIIKAESLDEATTIAHGCPVLGLGGTVEIRPLFVG
jgi:hypothetical protein